MPRLPRKTFGYTFTVGQCDLLLPTDKGVQPVAVDCSIATDLQRLNDAGFATTNSCSGLLEEHKTMKSSFNPPTFFVSFNPNSKNNYCVREAARRHEFIYGGYSGFTLIPICSPFQKNKDPNCPMLETNTQRHKNINNFHTFTDEVLTNCTKQ